MLSEQFLPDLTGENSEKKFAMIVFLTTLIFAGVLEGAIILQNDQVAYVTVGEEFTFYTNGMGNLSRNGVVLYDNTKCQATSRQAEKYIFDCSWMNSSVRPWVHVKIPAENMTDEENKSKWSFSETADDQIFVTSITLEVQVNPGEAPRIEGYISGSRLLTSDPPLTISCKVRKSWPHPTLRWNCPQLVFKERITLTQKDVVSQIQINITKDLDEKVCTCVAKHNVDNFNKSVFVRFVVLSQNETSGNESSCSETTASLIFVLSAMAVFVGGAAMILLIVLLAIVYILKKTCRSSLSTTEKNATWANDHISQGLKYTSLRESDFYRETGIDDRAYVEDSGHLYDVLKTGGNVEHEYGFIDVKTKENLRTDQGGGRLDKKKSCVLL